MGVDPKQRRPLDHSLERLEDALARSRASEALGAPASSAALVQARSSASVARQAGIPLMAVLLVVLLWMGATAAYFFFIPALFTGLGLAAMLARRKATPATALGMSSNGPYVGMGASVASDAVLREGSVVEMGATVGAAAVLERGAVVEMGATVGAAAVLERGVVVRMGASVGPRAVLKEGASVSWGASVGEGAVVGAGAVIAVGSDVGVGARVPAHAYLAPGTSWTAAQSDVRRLPAVQTREDIETASDPRAEQIRKACDRLEEEYARAPAPVRAMFGETRTTLSSLRRTCLDLVARERGLRAEASPEALERLEQEKAAIEARLALASDEQVKRSLSGAVTAIAAQQDQRKLLQNKADRLEAELTRLIWTVDGMGTELVRVRTAGTEFYQGSTAEIARSVEQLQDEINNIAQALEEVNSEQGAPER
jgi:carbonic anhydrase/acetyltransferase-like protein (isoleucine patch superfamily)